MSNKRTQMNEWQMADQTYISIANYIQQMDMREMQILQDTLLTKPATFVPKSGESWGSVRPESLIGKRARIRIPTEAEIDEYIIKDYDAEQEMHLMETTDSDTMEVDDSYCWCWIDLREIYPEDIIWEGGEKANFDAPNQSAATDGPALPT